MGSSVIETGVDRLIKLVQKKKRVSVSEAAKSLSVPQEVIDEWATFLEEEGVISVEYSFTTPYLVEKRLNNQDIAQKARELSLKKDYFVRKAESMLDSLEKQHTTIQVLQSDFDALRDSLGDRTRSLERAFKELSEFDLAKRDMEQKILMHEAQFHAHLTQQSRLLESEQKKYEKVLSEIKTEKKSIVREQEQAVSIRSQEARVVRQLDQLNNVIAKLRQTVVDEDNYILTSEKNLRHLLSLSTDIADEIASKKEHIEKLTTSWKEHENALVEKQEEILRQIQDKSKAVASKIKGQSEAVSKLKNFFSRKQRVENLLQDITSEHERLRQDLITLVKKAKTFGVITSKGNSVSVQEIQNAFTTVEKRKKGVEQKLGLLSRAFAQLGGKKKK